MNQIWPDSVLPTLVGTVVVIVDILDGIPVKFAALPLNTLPATVPDAVIALALVIFLLLSITVVLFTLTAIFVLH
jgi:hypothetical protein